nr:hypothetical protein [Pseudomonas matsuisoli]
MAKREAIPQAKAGVLPNLSAEATTDRSTLSRDEPELRRSRSGTVLRARLSQPLFRLDPWYQLKAAQASTEQARSDMEPQLSVQRFLLSFSSVPRYAKRKVGAKSKTRKAMWSVLG